MSIKKLKIRAYLRVALWRATDDSATRKRDVERQHIYVALAADYGNLGDLAITRAQIDFLEKEFPDAVIEPIPISHTLPAIKRLRTAIRDEDIITLIGGGNTGDMYDDIQYLRELYVKNFSRNRIISFPQTIEFSDTPYGWWASQRARKVYNSHPALTVMARDSVSYRRGSTLFAKCRVVLSPDVVLTLDEVAPAGTRYGVLVALRSDLERGLDAADHQIVLSIAGAWGDLNERDTHVGDVRLDAEEARSELTGFWTACRSSQVVVTDRLHGMIFSVITRTPCLALDSGTGKVSQFYRDWLQDVPTVRLLNRVDATEFRQALLELTHVRGVEPPSNFAKRFAVAFAQGFRNKDWR